MNSLPDAIENLYAAFADVPAPKTIDGCSHCFEAEAFDALLSIELRQTSPETLSPYASSAFLTAGDVPDYVYFLPRILEVSVSEKYWWPDFEVTGRAIRDAGWRSWPKHHLDALIEFLDAAIRHFAESGDSWQIGSWMCGIASAELDVRPFLKIIETDDEAVIGYFEVEAGKLAEGKLSNAFWQLPNEGHDSIVEWFRSEKVARILYEAFGQKM